MYQGNSDGKWHVCQLAAKGRGWRENIIATYGPRQKKDALKCLEELVTKKSPLVVLK